MPIVKTNIFKYLTNEFTAVLWICLGGLLFTLLIMSTVSLNMDGTDEWVTSALFTVFIGLGLVSAICVRYLFGMKNSNAAFGPKAWTVVWAYPIATMLVMSPWILAGVLADSETSILMSVWLLLLFVYIMLLLGFLLVPFAVLPLELIGKGAIQVIRGNRKQGSSMLIIGGYIALVTAFAFVGAGALSDMPPAQAGWAHIVFALLGLPGVYTIENEGLLWLARLMAVVLIAVPIAASRMKVRSSVIESTIVDSYGRSACKK
jgi:hypothetical protein